MKTLSLKVVEDGGIVRGIHNHGVRDLPHRFKAKFPDRQGNRYFTRGRFISVYYDSNPSTMRQVEQLLDMDEEVLRNTHLRARSVLDFVNISREDRNPFIKEVKREQALERQAVQHRNETVEQTIEDMRTDS